MLFSLIVPVYNTKEYLETCLNSIEAQSFDDFELIIIDDGSEDGSGAICDEFCDRFNADKNRKRKGRVIHQENVGLSGVRNRGIQEAKGDWLWFIDSDDFIVPDALETLYERMRYAKGDLYVFQYIKVNDEGKDPEYIYFREMQNIVQFKKETDLLDDLNKRLFCYKDSWETWTRLFNREIILKNNLSYKNTKDVFAEDLCFATEYMMCIEKSVMLVNYLYCYRMRSDSIMRSLDQNNAFSSLFNLLEDIYLEAKRFRKKVIINQFDSIVFSVLKTHIIKFDVVSEDDLIHQIEEGMLNKSIGKYVRKNRQLLYCEVKTSRKEKISTNG